jgi:hypothetical protein
VEKHRQCCHTLSLSNTGKTLEINRRNVCQGHILELVLLNMNQTTISNR